MFSKRAGVFFLIAIVLASTAFADPCEASATAVKVSSVLQVEYSESVAAQHFQSALETLDAGQRFGLLLPIDAAMVKSKFTTEQWGGFAKRYLITNPLLADTILDQPIATLSDGTRLIISHSNGTYFLNEKVSVIKTIRCGDGTIYVIDGQL